MSSVSSAMRLALLGRHPCSACAYCAAGRRASPAARARRSAIASSSLRKFSACSARCETRSSFLIFVSPSTSVPMSSPNCLSISASRRLGVFDRVVQERRDDRGVVELKIRQDRGDLERMRKIRVARRPVLGAVRLHGVNESPIEQCLVRRWIVATDTIDEFVLSHHRRKSDSYNKLNGLFGFSKADPNPRELPEPIHQHIAPL